MVRDTVAVETLARLAISLMFIDPSSRPQRPRPPDHLICPMRNIPVRSSRRDVVDSAAGRCRAARKPWLPYICGPIKLCSSTRSEIQVQSKLYGSVGQRGSADAPEIRDLRVRVRLREFRMIR